MTAIVIDMKFLNSGASRIFSLVNQGICYFDIFSIKIDLFVNYGWFVLLYPKTLNVRSSKA